MEVTTPAVAEVLECTSERVDDLDESLTVLHYDGRKWLIGVQVAAALNRETFNMYRSMKVKNIDLTRAAPAHVDWLIRKGVVKSGTHSVTLIPYDAGLAFIRNVISTGGLTTSVLPKKIKKPNKSVEGGSKRPREPVMIMHHLTPTSDRLAAAVATTKMQSASASGSGGSLSLDDEDEEDSDDFSDDVVQPTKRRRTSAASRSAVRRLSPRRTTRSAESPLATRSPSYNLSSFPRYPTSFANARFMPTQATIPTLPDDDDETRPSRRVRRWPSTSSIARKESPTVHQSAGPRRPLSRRKQAPWQVMRAVQKEDCVPFKFRKRMEDDGADEGPSLAAALLHSFMRAVA